LVAVCGAGPSTVLCGPVVTAGGGRNYVGYVVGRDDWTDTVLIYTGDTGWTASQEWDGPGENAAGQHVYDVTEDADYSYIGDMTCQDGFSIGIRCGLLVTNGYAYWEARRAASPTSAWRRGRSTVTWPATEATAAAWSSR
jgi:hypothetical protein